jgi:hypothetical protein
MSYSINHKDLREAVTELARQDEAAAGVVLFFVERILKDELNQCATSMFRHLADAIDDQEKDENAQNEGGE